MISRWKPVKAEPEERDNERKELREGEMTESEPEQKNGMLYDNRGVGVVEVILILVVLIALVLIFKEQLGNMVTKAMEALEKSMNEVLS